MSLGPLTTIFQPSPTCLVPSNIWQIFTTTTSQDQSTFIYQLLGPPPTSDCLPGNYVPESTAYYSPGRCPSGYSVVTQYVNTYGDTRTETTQTCCPSVEGFDFGAAPTSTTYTNVPFLTSIHCTSAYTKGTTYCATFSSLGSVIDTDIAVETGEGINAFGVVVRFQPTDFAGTIAPSSTAQPSSTAASTAETTSIPASKSIPSSLDSSDAGGGLSSGAKAGIGVGVVGCVCVIALAIAVGFIIGRRKKERHKNGNNPTVRDEYSLRDMSWPYQQTHSWPQDQRIQANFSIAPHYGRLEAGGATIDELEHVHKARLVDERHELASSPRR